MPSARIQWIDFCRVWTAFFVIVRHTYAPEGTLFFYADLFNYRSLIFFFFFASGLFSKQISDCNGRLISKWMDIKRFGQIASMFLFWSAVGALLLLPVHWQEVWKSGEIIWGNVVHGLGFTWMFGWNVPLWFLRVLMVLVLFAPLLHRLSSRNLLAFVIGMLAAGEVFCLTAWDEGGPAYTWIPCRMYETLYAWAFFAAGIVLKRELGIEGLAAFLKKSGWLIVFFAVLVFVPVRLWGLMPPCKSGMLVVLGVGTILSIGCLVNQYAPRICSYVAAWGPATFFVYVTHCIIITYIKALWLRYNEWNTVGSIIVPVATLLVSCGVFVLLRKLSPRFMSWCAMLKVVKK